MTDSSRWLLLVEDDPLFSRIFCRFWTSTYPEIPCRVVTSLESMREVLENSDLRPGLIVCDRRLPDGFAQPADFSPGTPFVIWSADLGPSYRTKPVGRQELEQAIQEFRSQFDRNE